VPAAIGQPMAKADHHHHKIIPSADIEERQRSLTTKAILAVITTGKTNLALPSMHLSEPLH
jgi:UV DNA damage repair endonuclease